MKKHVLLLLVLSLCGMQDVMVRPLKEDFCVQRALMDKNLAPEKREQVLRECFDCNAKDHNCCKRGPRGPRGKRGRRGRRGPAGTDATCGMNELFINAQMMAWFSEGTFPPSNAFNAYGIGTNMLAWELAPSAQSNPPIGANFNIPIDLDRTQPVTVVAHLLVDAQGVTPPTGNLARLQVQIDYQPNNGLLGATPPATGFADVQNSADFIVTQAVPPFSDNLRQISVSIPLDQTQIDGEWAFITIGRIAPAGAEYNFNVYLSTISVQYSRICLLQ